MKTIRMHQLDLLQNKIDSLRKIDPTNPIHDVLNDINYHLVCMAWDLARLSNPTIKIPEKQVSETQK